MNLSKLYVPLIALAMGISSCGGGDSKTGEGGSNEGGANEQAAANAGDAAHGAQLYQQTCTPCHGPGGKGDGPAAATLNPKPADHTNKAILGARSDEDLKNIIKMGGGVVGKPTMPPSPQFSDKDLTDLVAHLRNLSGTEHK